MTFFCLRRPPSPRSLDILAGAAVLYKTVLNRAFTLFNAFAPGFEVRGNHWFVLMFSFGFYTVWALPLTPPRRRRGKTRTSPRPNSNLQALPRLSILWTTTPGRARGRGGAVSAAARGESDPRRDGVKGVVPFSGGRRRATIGGSGKRGWSQCLGQPIVCGQAEARTGRGSTDSRAAWGSPSPGTQVSEVGTRSSRVPTAGRGKWRRDGAARTWWWNSATPR